MRLDLIAESLLERLALALGRVPSPLAQTHLAFVQARAIMEGVRLGLFDVLAEGAKPAEAVAEACGTHPEATRQLLGALVGARYLKAEGEAYALTRRARRWLVGPDGVQDKLLYQFYEWELVSTLGTYVETGQPVGIHEAMTPDQWAAYGRAMQAVARLSAGEVARRFPLPRGATTLLDIGGSHGLYAAALCARHPLLQATVLDLPQALAQTTPPHARVSLWQGDALDADLGTARWNAILLSSLAHHLSAEQNQALARRVATSLRPGGVFVIQEYERANTPRSAREAGLGALLDLYFGATSRSRTWSIAEMQHWQAEAGLVVQQPIRLRTLPGFVQVVGQVRGG